MRRLGISCIDCGCNAVGSIVDEVKPVFRMEIVNFACGAVFKSEYTIQFMVSYVKALCVARRVRDKVEIA